MKQTLYAILFIAVLFVIAASVTSCSKKTTVYSKSIDNCPTWVSKTK